MTPSLHKEMTCLILQKESINISDVVWETKCVNWLYPIQPSSLPSASLAASKVVTRMSTDYKHWYEDVGHISSERYRMLSNLASDVPTFPRSITNDHHCILYIKSKSRKTYQNFSETKTWRSSDSLRFPGLLKERINRNTYSLHLLDGRTSYYGVNALISKDKD